MRAFLNNRSGSRNNSKKVLVLPQKSQSYMYVFEMECVLETVTNITKKL